MIYKLIFKLDSFNFEKLMKKHKHNIIDNMSMKFF